MNIKSMGFKNQRIERFLFERAAEESWPVETAKSRLTEIMRRAQSGETQIVGKRKPVIIISVEELERMLVGFSQPETWGERFLPPVSEAGLGEALELPEHSRSVKDNFNFAEEYAEEDFASEGVGKWAEKEMQG